MKYRPLPLAACLVTLALFPAALHSQTPAESPVVTVIDGSTTTIQIKPSSDQVGFKVAEDGISVTIKPGVEGYPGITITNKDGKPFDFSKHGHIEAKISNSGTKEIGISLRVDNEGDWKLNPYNAELLYLKPGESKLVTLIFGHSYGKKKSYPLKTQAISRILFFGGKSEADQSFKIESVSVGGPPGEVPPVDPATIRTQPAGGVLFNAASTFNGDKQLDFKNGATASFVVGQGLRAIFPGGKQTASIGIKPEKGRWDLSQQLQVVVNLKNDGTEAVRPTLRLDSNGGPSDTIEVESIEPGKSRQIVIPFESKLSWVGDGEADKKGTGGSKPRPGSKVTSDAVAAIFLSVPNIESERSIVIESITANLPPTPKLPEWLGKKPPVEGDWVKTFDDNFDGNAIDASKWNVYAANYWDKASAFSKDNLIVGGGFAKLRYEKKTSHHADDPAKPKFNYTTGFLDTYGKWVQRYGYFETRTKLPKAPGLWPAFWLMPDRGAAAGEQWKRQDTGNGGMEFDIVEHLTRWGPYRYNVAMHWDGYGKDHKAIGTSNIYVQPDKDGFVTTGLLWLPGSAVYYFNGKEAARWETTRMSAIPSHLMYTLPQGGWDNNAVDDQQLPADFTIDYVRVWQRKDLASDSDGAKTPAEKK